MKRLLLPAVIVLGASAATAQSVPQKQTQSGQFNGGSMMVQGYIPTPAEWANAFRIKQDVLAFPLSLAFGGCGSITASGCRTNIEAAASGANSDITSLNSLSTPLSLAQGGTSGLTFAIAQNGLGNPSGTMSGFAVGDQITLAL